MATREEAPRKEQRSGRQRAIRLTPPAARLCRNPASRPEIRRWRQSRRRRRNGKSGQPEKVREASVATPCQHCRRLIPLARPGRSGPGAAQRGRPKNRCAPAGSRSSRKPTPCLKGRYTSENFPSVGAVVMGAGQGKSGGARCHRPTLSRLPGKRGYSATPPPR